MLKFKVILLTLLLFFQLSPGAFSAQTELTWESSPSTDVAGYKVYYKANNLSLPFNGTGANEGASPIDVGESLSFTISGLNEDSVYYFSITAYDSSGLESQFSNIVSFDSRLSSERWYPELIKPQDQAVNEPIPVTFQWTTNTSDTNLSYTLYYGTDQNLVAGSSPLRKYPHSSHPENVWIILTLLALFPFALRSKGTLPKPATAYALFCMLLFASACGSDTQQTTSISTQNNEISQIISPTGQSSEPQEETPSQQDQENLTSSPSVEQSEPAPESQGVPQTTSSSQVNTSEPSQSEVVLSTETNSEPEPTSNQQETNEESQEPVTVPSSAYVSTPSVSRQPAQEPEPVISTTPEMPSSQWQAPEPQMDTTDPVLDTSTPSTPTSTRSVDPQTESPQTIYAVDKGTSDYHQAFDLQPSTTYFWKIVATDLSNPDIFYTSPVYQFTTEQF